MDSVHFQASAQGLLTKLQGLSEQLLNLLQQEYKTLSTSHAESLDTITLKKQPVIVQINSDNQKWLALLSQECQDMSPQGIGQFLDNYDAAHASSLSPQWEKLQTLAKACEKSNTINGTIITLRYQSAQQTLAILRGQIPGDTVYNPKGNNSTGYSGGSALAKA